jgi:transglutaminase-like putative cysteine protease
MNDIKEYLKSSDIVDYDDPQIIRLARDLSKGIEDEIQLAKAAYEYVRDDILHSNDIGGTIVTYKASDVLKHKQGVCYAKAHLLAAILRYLGIPAGFCYQVLILDDGEKPQLIVHGLNAIYLKSLSKWIRVDARGNKPGVNAEFSIDEEKLAFPVREELGEKDGQIVYASPNGEVVRALMASLTVSTLMGNLPSEL